MSVQLIQTTQTPNFAKISEKNKADMPHPNKKKLRSNNCYIIIFLLGFLLLFIILLLSIKYSNKPKVSGEQSYHILNEFNRILFFTTNENNIKILSSFQIDKGDSNPKIAINAINLYERAFFNSFNDYNKWMEGELENYDEDKKLAGATYGIFHTINKLARDKAHFEELDENDKIEFIESLKYFIFMWLSTSPEFDRFLREEEIKGLDQKIFSKYFLYLVTGDEDLFKIFNPRDFEEENKIKNCKKLNRFSSFYKNYMELLKEMTEEELEELEDISDDYINSNIANDSDDI